MYNIFMKLKGIDLFAGIGGFHLAAKQNGVEIVFASEIDIKTAMVYENNFNLKPSGDITEIREEDIEPHDILMGGFPCQPFSKAGLRKGFDDTRGTLFFDILRIIKYHKPKFLLLENVQSLASHDGGNTWKVIRDSLRKEGYLIPNNPIVVSPKSFGTPQIRKRVFIPGIIKQNAKGNELKINIPEEKTVSIENIRIKEFDSDDKLKLNDYQRKVVEAWSEFKNLFDDHNDIQHPIWSYEFFKDRDMSNDPVWKQNWTRRNRELYLDNKKMIDEWYDKWGVSQFRRQDQKLEWNAKDKITNLKEGILQFRSSGLRVKTPDVAPTLVAKNDRIIMPGGERFISIEECAKLQDFPKWYKWSISDNLTLKQLGNAVNVKVTSHMLKELLNNEKK